MMTSRRKFLFAALAAAGLAGSAGGAAAVAQQPVAPPDVQPMAAGAGELFLFIYRPGPAWRAGVPMHEQDLRPHGLYVRDLVAQGRAFAGGGFVSSDGGMAIVMASDMDEARAMLAADPAIRDGIFVASIEQWRPRFGTDSPMPRPR